MSYKEEMLESTVAKMTAKETESVIISYYDGEEIYLKTLKEVHSCSGARDPFDSIVKLWVDFEVENVELAIIKHGKFKKLALFSEL